MAFTSDSRVLSVKNVNGTRTLFKANRDDIRRVPSVQALPLATESREGLTVLYDDGEGECEYICVKTADGSYAWVSAMLIRRLIPWEAVEKITNSAYYEDGLFSMEGNGITFDGDNITIDDGNVIVDGGILTFQ